MRRFGLLAASMLAAATWATAAAAADTPGVTKTEIKIGNTMPYSGPVSSYSPIGKLDAAFFKMVNDAGRRRRAQDRFHFAMTMATARRRRSRTSAV